MERCLSLIDVIWTPGRRKEALGEKSWRGDSTPDASASQALYPFQGSAFRAVVLEVPWYCVLYPTILGQRVQCPTTGRAEDLKNTW